MKNFLSKLFTIRNLSKIITIFLIGIILRYFVNEYTNISIFTEYFGPIIILNDLESIQNDLLKAK